MAQACNPNTLRGQGGWITRSGVQDQPGQNGEALSVLKTQKLARHVWWRAPVILATQEAEAEVAVSQDRATALQPEQEWDSISKTKQQQQNMTVEYLEANMSFIKIIFSW